MHWAIYADPTRELSAEERRVIAAALDEFVPSGGCVGLQAGSVEEVYFSVEAGTEAEARARAHLLVDAILRKAGVQDEYRIHLKPYPAA